MGQQGRKGHPNRVSFSGILTRVDEPSNRSPTGAKGHKVILTREAAEEALSSLIGMAVDYKAGWSGHNARQKFGVITDAVFSGRDILVRGYIYARDFGEEAEEIYALGEELGMSYELANALVVDVDAKVWVLKRVTFVGAAVLLKSKAAYRSTSFTLHNKEAPVPVHLDAACVT